MRAIIQRLRNFGLWEAAAVSAIIGSFYVSGIILLFTR
jgi:hypothetical protein